MHHADVCGLCPIYFLTKGGNTRAMIRAALVFLALLAPLSPASVAGQTGADLSALARLDAPASQITGTADGLRIRIALSQPVPWRVRVLDNPARLLMDFREVDWASLPYMPVDSEAILGLRAGVFRPTWSRLVVQLATPMVVKSAQMQTGNETGDKTGGVAQQSAVVEVTLRSASPAEFAAAAALPEPPEWGLPRPADLPPPRLPLARKTGPMVVVLDPGHGGLDPGAEAGDLDEADLMLGFAREVKEALLRTGEAEVVLTRDADIFVPLEARISIARAAGADVFLSLHADALAEGGAKGATIYTLSEEATDKAASTLAERHDRDDLLAGVDLTAQDDLVARVLIDMARLETTPRVGRLATALEGAIKGAGLKMHRRARQTAGFSVLKSPDIPSVLLELGFMSSQADLANLQDDGWRAQMAGAITAGLLDWARAERAAP